MNFLTAEWRKLAIANYVVDQKVLLKYVPQGTELDLWNDKCYVSLIGFMFINTRVLGIPVPFHTDFEEVNLRFYVKRKEGKVWKRGVVFIKEFVPKSAITLLANALYDEHYQTVKMNHIWHKGDSQTVQYRWRVGGMEHSIEIKSQSELVSICDGSEEDFITEHYWGYTKVHEDKTYEYEVKHPKWNCYEVDNYKINVDFGSVYGDDFRFLDNLQPKSVFLVEGSEISVGSRTLLK